MLREWETGKLQYLVIIYIKRNDSEFLNFSNFFHIPKIAPAFIAM